MSIWSGAAKDVEVRISRRTLFVDEVAYPLAHVTQVRPLEIKPRRARMVIAFGREAGAWLGLALLGGVLVSCLGNTVPRVVLTVCDLIVLAVLIWHITRLIRRLTLKPLYVLSIAMSGPAHAAVASRDRDKIFDLAQRVIDAIDDPAMEYTIHVDQIDVKGDFVHGDKHGGDNVFGNKYATGG